MTAALSYRTKRPFLLYQGVNWECQSTTLRECVSRTHTCCSRTCITDTMKFGSWTNFQGIQCLLSSLGMPNFVIILVRGTTLIYVFFFEPFKLCKFGQLSRNFHCCLRARPEKLEHNNCDYDTAAWVSCSTIMT